VSYISRHEEYEDLANPRPRKGTFLLLAIAVGLLILGASLALFLFVRR
jgi:hypothetical protein